MNDVKTENKEKLLLDLTLAQADGLSLAFELMKAFSSPSRLAIVGWLAARPNEVVTVEEIVRHLPAASPTIERDLNQLAEVGLLKVVEWHSARPGHEPQPYRIAFNPEYARQVSPAIAVLAGLNRQLQPENSATKMDERTKTLGTFLKNGRLLTFPSQLRKQIYVVEEVARVFEPGLRYSERQVDAILKEIYEYDYCTLRRYLVDLNLLARSEGVYWKPQPTAAPV